MKHIILACCLALLGVVLIAHPAAADSATVAISRSEYDATEDAATVVTLVGSTVLSATWSGLYFGVSIPTNATILSATLTLTPTATITDAANYTIYGHKNGGSPFAAVNADISARTKTTANVAFTPSPWNAGQAVTVDVTTILQELVNGSGWGNKAILLVKQNAAVYLAAHAYDGSPDHAAVLFAEWVAATPTPTITPSPSPTTTPSPTPTHTPTPPPTATPLPVAYYTVYLPSGGEAHIIMEISAGEAITIMVLSLLSAVTIFDMVRRMVRSGSIR